MHLKFNSAKHLCFYLSHPCSMTKVARGSDGSKHCDKILIGANENGVAIIGQRDNQSYERIIPTSEFSLIQSGAIAVESTKLLGVMRTFGDQSVELILKENERPSNSKENKPSYKLQVKSGRSRIHINEVVEANEVPRSNVALKDAKSFHFSLNLLKEMIQSVKPCLTEDCSQANMRCLQLKVSSDTISASTVDGLRLAIAKAKLAQPYDGELIALIPTRVVDMILSLTAEMDDCVISIAKSAMAITVGSLKFQSSLVDVRYPDLNKVMPSETLGFAVVQAKPFIEVLERAKIAVDISTSANNNIPSRIVINFNTDGNLHCESFKNANLITEEDFLSEKIQLKSSESLVTAFDYTFLQQAINSMKSSMVSLTLAKNNHGNESDPAMVLITPLDQAKPFTLMSLIMPQRT
ncbi:hypothetical protein [Vibrio sp. 10N.239.312.D08]|uniref:DNA polymerase III subunit beta family protein n=1 Tax=Vibrio sp. 10N.239.312.D08 TaxID=3229978 RepID=UPI0035518CB3